jgi:AraC-like DNA-binding protein
MTKASKISTIKEVVSKIAAVDGSHPTAIPFLSILRVSQPTSLRQGVLRPSICVVVQGKKKLLFDEEVYSYGAGSYVVSVIDLPSAGQILDVNAKNPYFGLVLNLDVQEVASIVVEAGIDLNAEGAQGVGAFVGSLSPELLSCFVKMVKLLKSEKDAIFLAPALRREIIYRLLTSADGRKFFKNIVTNHQDAGIGRAIVWLKNNFDQELKIKDLARVASMSISSLHHKFKDVTTMGPLQFQKQLRLQEARRLMLAGSHDVGSAAFEVGYESASQFSREYRRLFGEAPALDVKQLRLRQGIEAVQN